MGSAAGDPATKPRILPPFPRRLKCLRIQSSAMSDQIPAAPSIPVLTIDGPSASGKGTISRLVALRQGWHYLDSGALYRAVGLAAGSAGGGLSDASALVRCTFDTDIDFRENG